MHQVWRLCFIAILGAVVLSVPAMGLITPIGCGADGFCNTFCSSDPDCGPPQCVPDKPCTTDADCQPLGFCATYRLCVCTG